ncbi:hypothetical protein F2Q69_00041209 [Brassica cretica]|uniref:Uncharacterized protein n=1 Tax=Brassica cretica TaxID=69181 RepID=A0A8S9NCS3_BRACR|nr:hypothetical protein F2Q69_00041209 [Brassica cretica]
MSPKAHQRAQDSELTVWSFGSRSGDGDLTMIESRSDNLKNLLGESAPKSTRISPQEDNSTAQVCLNQDRRLGVRREMATTMIKSQSSRDEIISSSRDKVAEIITSSTIFSTKETASASSKKETERERADRSLQTTPHQLASAPPVLVKSSQVCNDFWIKTPMVLVSVYTSCFFINTLREEEKSDLESITSQATFSSSFSSPRHTDLDPEFSARSHQALASTSQKLHDLKKNMKKRGHLAKTSLPQPVRASRQNVKEAQPLSIYQRRRSQAPSRALFFES